METPSYARINYSLRPSKHVERRMIFEALRRLDRLASLSHYRYVGFGSPYFTDFRIAHRELGIRSMVNIEHPGDEQRFAFNRPFGGLSLEFGTSGEVLDRLDWHGRSIVWLDNDKPLNLEQLADVEKVVGRAASGSVFLITTNAQPESRKDERVRAFQRRLGEYMPFDLVDPDLIGNDRTVELYWSIIQEVVRKAIITRNEGVAADARVEYNQWFNFRYADGARMMTVGGLIADCALEAHVAGLGMDQFQFVRTGKEHYDIVVPQLTLKEMSHLESKFPCEPADVDLLFLSQAEIKSYQDVYRYFPRYADVDL